MKTLCIAALAAVSLLGCSTDVSDLFSDGDAQGGAGGALAATTGADKTAATNGPGPTSTTGGQTTTVGQTVTTGATTDSATATTTVSTGGQLPNVWCDNQPCGAGEVCCYWLYEKGQDHCAQPGTCPDPDEGWLEISCNGPDDCPGQACCGEHIGQTWVDISCHSNCNGGGLFEMCEPGNDACVAGQCNQSQVLGNGYGYCGN